MSQKVQIMKNQKKIQDQKQKDQLSTEDRNSVLGSFLTQQTTQKISQCQDQYQKNTKPNLKDQIKISNISQEESVDNEEFSQGYTLQEIQKDKMSLSSVQMPQQEKQQSSEEILLLKENMSQESSKRQSSGIYQSPDLFIIQKNQVNSQIMSTINKQKSKKQRQKPQPFSQKIQLRQLLKNYELTQQDDVQQCWNLLAEKKDINKILEDYIYEADRDEVSLKLQQLLNSLYPSASKSQIKQIQKRSKQQSQLEQLFKKQKYKLKKESFEECLTYYKKQLFDQKIYPKIPKKQREQFKNQIQKIHKKFKSYSKILIDVEDLNELEKKVKPKFIENLQTLLNKIQKQEYRPHVKKQILQSQNPDLIFLSHQYQENQIEIQKFVKDSTTTIKIKYNNDGKKDIKLGYLKRDQNFQKEFQKILYETLLQKNQFLIYKNKGLLPIKFDQILNGKQDEMQKVIQLEIYPKQQFFYNFGAKEKQSIYLSLKLSNLRVKNLIKKDILSKNRDQILDILVSYISYKTQAKKISLDEDEKNTLNSIQCEEKFFFRNMLMVLIMVEIKVYYRGSVKEIPANLSNELFLIKNGLEQAYGVPIESQQLFKMNKQQKQDKILLDDQPLWKICDQNHLNFSLILQNNASKQFYGFNKNIKLTFQQFCKFHIENQEEKKKFLQNFNSKTEQEFFWFFLNYLYSGLKKQFPISLIIKNFQKGLSESNIQIWKTSKGRKKKFNDEFVLNYLLKNAEPKLRVQIIKLVQQYLPIPLYLKEYTSIANIKIAGKYTLLEELIWILKEGFTISSVGLHQKWQKGAQQLGKSFLLNRLFKEKIVQLNFGQTDRKHKISKQIPHIRHRYYREKFPLHIIDIPKNCENWIKSQVFKASNIIIVHSWKSQQKTREHVQKLSNEYNACVICFIRDNDNKELSRVKLTHKAVRSIINIKNQEQNQWEIQSLKKQLLKLIKKQQEEQNNQKKIFTLYQKSEVKEIIEQALKLSQFIKKNPFNCCPINNIQKQIQHIQNKSRNRSQQDQKKIKQLQQKIRKQGLSPQITQILSFYNKYKNHDFYDLIQTYMRDEIKSIQKKNTQELLQIYNYKMAYKQIVQKQTLDKNYKKKELHEKMKRMKIVYPFKELNILSLKEEDSQIWFKQIIRKIQNQIKPGIFSIELLYREIFGLIKNDDQIKFQQNLLFDILTNLKKSQVKRNLPFELIDGDLLEMPRLLMSQVFKDSQKRCLFITILGPQSSGKSTLLNKLFGSDFATSQGRCTKGVYGTYYPFSQNSGVSQIFNYQGIFVIDTQGLFSIANQNQNLKSNQQTENSYINQKKRNFDAKLVVFCLAISDIVIINVKSNIDNNTKVILQLCKQKLQKLNIPKEREPSVAIILNQATSSNIRQSQQYLQKISQIMTFSIKKSLQFGYNNKEFKSDLFEQNQTLTKQIPTEQFLAQTQTLLSQIIKQIKKIKQILPITQKIKICQRIWSDILQFPDLSIIKSKEQIQIQNKIQQWLNAYEIDRDLRISKIKEKLKQKQNEKNQKKSKQIIINKIIQEQSQQYLKQLLKRFEQQFCTNINDQKQQIKKIIINQKDNLKQRNNSWKNQLQYILTISFYQQYIKRLKFQNDPQLNQKCKIIKDQIINNKRNYTNEELTQIFQQIFNSFISKIQKELAGLEKNELSFKKNKQDFKYLIKGSSNYGLPQEKKISFQFFINFLNSQKNQLQTKEEFKKMLYQQLLKPIINQFDYCLESTQSKAYTMNLLEGKTDSKNIYFNMSEYFQVKQKKRVIVFNKAQLFLALNKIKIKEIINQNSIKNQTQKNGVKIIFNLINSKLETNNGPILMKNFQSFYKVYKNKNQKYYSIFWRFDQQQRVALKIISKKQNNQNSKEKELICQYFKQSLKYELFSGHYIGHLQQKFQNLLDWNYIKEQIQKMKQNEKAKIQLNKLITLKINEDLKQLNLRIQKQVDWVNQNDEQIKKQFQIRQIKKQIAEVLVYSSLKQFNAQLKTLTFFKHKILKDKKIILEINDYQASKENKNNLLVGKIQTRNLQPIVKKKNLKNYIDSNIKLMSLQLSSRQFKQFVFKELLTGTNKKSSKIMCEKQKKQVELNSFYKFITQCLKMVDQQFNSQDKTISKEMLIKVINKVKGQLANFNADLNQVSLQLTNRFKSYSYYLISCYVWFLTKSNKQEKNRKLIQSKMDQKQEDRKYFFNNISNDQYKLSQNDSKIFQNAILEYLKKQYSTSIEMLIKKIKLIKNSKNFKNKFNRKQIQENLDLQILGKQNKNTYDKKKALDYIKNPATYIRDQYEKITKNQMQEIQKQLKNKFSVFFQNQQNFVKALFQITKNLENKFTCLQFQEATFTQFFVSDKNQRLLIQKNQSLNNDNIKITWMKYFINKLIKADKQDLLFGVQKIIEKQNIKTNEDVILPQKLIHFLKQIKQNQKLKISNLYHFLKLITQSKWKLNLRNKVQEIFKLKQQDKKQIKLLFSVIVCEEKCPCCNRICGLQGNHTSHKVIYGHQFRGFNGTCFQSFKKQKIASVLRCQQIAESDMVEYNGMKSWTAFKNYWKNKDPGSWTFEDLPSTKYMYQDLFSKVWDDIGRQTCFQQNIKFVPSRYTYQQQKKQQQNMHFIFALDESGSMSGEKWNSLILALSKNINSLKDQGNVTISILKFGIQAKMIYQNISPKQVNISNLTMLSTNNTLFEPPFKEAYQTALKYIKDKITVFIFMTDGLSTYPTIGVKKFQELINLNPNRFIYRSIHLTKKNQKKQTELLNKIASGLKGFNVQTFDPKELQIIYKNVMYEVIKEYKK